MGGFVEDARIIELYWARQESAIEHTKAKYGPYCRSIAYRILMSDRDAEECVNDTYLGAWSSMPPHRPTVLSAFLAKITRNISLKRYRARKARKRQGDEVAVSLDELEECLPATGSVEQGMEAQEVARAIDRFLADLPVEQRRMFMCRYFHFESVDGIAQRFSCSSSKVKMSLKRTRDKLATYLEKEGVEL